MLLQLVNCCYLHVVEIEGQIIHIQHLHVYISIKLQLHVNVTCYGKIDHLQFFIKTEFLPWIDSPMCAESSGASFISHKWSYDHFIMFSDATMFGFFHFLAQAR